MIDRYCSKEMKYLFSDENKYNNFLKIEEAVLEAYVNLNVIPQEDYLKIVSKAHIDLKQIYEIENITKHDVIAFTRSISTQLQEEKKWFHYSLTSTDVVDSAQSLILNEANQYLKEDIEKLLKTCKEKALKYQNTPIMGRTHGIHAEVTSFGLKWALWYDELNRAYQRFLNERSNIEIIKLSGAVGNYANIPMEVEEFVANKFCLNYSTISTQVLSRDRHLSYIFSLASIASTLEKMALEIRHLSRSEVKEVEEYFASGQKGSSAMPHKKNPIGCENICGCARILKSYVQVAFENNALWHERDISHSSAERIMLPDAISLLHYMLKRFNKICEELIVYEDKMLQNIHLTYDVVFSGRVLQELINQGMSREAAYDLIQPIAFKAMNEKISFMKLLFNDQIIKKCLTVEQIESCFDIGYYLKNTKKIYKRLGW